MRQCLTAGVVRPRESPLSPLARVGPTTPKLIDPSLLRSIRQKRIVAVGSDDPATSPTAVETIRLGTVRTTRRVEDPPEVPTIAVGLASRCRGSNHPTRFATFDWLSGQTGRVPGGIR